MIVKQSSRYVLDTGEFYNDLIGLTKTVTTTRTKLDNYRESTPNPRYKQIIKDEGNATTPLYAYSQFGSTNPVRYEVIRNSGVRLIDTWGGASFSATPLTVLGQISTGQVNAAVSEATAKTYKRISEYQSSFNGQVFAGELREVIELIKDPFAKSAKLTDAFLRTVSFDGLKLRNTKLHRGRSEFALLDDLGANSLRAGSNMVKNLRKVSKSTADLYLEYQFAVAPLMGDVAKLLSLAADIADKRDHETIRAYGKSESSTSSSNLSIIGSGYSAPRYIDTVVKVENIIRCGMTAKFIDTLANRNSKNPWVDSLDDFLSIPITALELTPLSFLADYFVNVQDILQSSIVSQSGIAYTSNSIIRDYRTTTRFGEHIITRPDYIKSVKNLQSPKTIVSGVRSVTRTGTLLSIPPVVFHLPGSNVRYANIAALLTRFI